MERMCFPVLTGVNQAPDESAYQNLPNSMQSETQAPSLDLGRFLLYLQGSPILIGCSGEQI